MPFCPVCGKENDEQAPFCDNCRAPLPGGSTIGAQPQTDQNERMTGAPRGSARPINHAVLILIGIIVLLCIFFVYSHAAADGIITTVAGTGTQGYTGDGGPAAGAELNYPIGVAFDASGNLYIADTENNRVCRVDRAGVITTVAGNGTKGYTGDGDRPLLQS